MELTGKRVEARRDVLTRGVDVMVSAELPRLGFLVPAARNRDGVVAHLGRVLHREVSQAADTVDRHEIARSRAALP